MTIDWVIPCRYVEVHDNLATILGAGVDTFWFQELPSPLQVAMAVRLNAMADELGDDQQHHVTTRVRDPSGNQISEVEGDISISGEAARPDYLVGVTLASAIVFEVTEEGTYAIEFEVDHGASTATLPIHAVLGSPG